MGRLLLHACCGPCSLEPVRLYTQEGWDITLDYENPNIHPSDEYEKRAQTIREWAASEGVAIIEGAYDPDTWEQRVGCFGPDRESRCRACYRLRFERAAQIAAEGGYDAIGTTLSVSPYQFTDVIAEELRRAADAVGIPSAFRDFRENYHEATNRSRALGMYRQRYCGCRLSIAEAEADRAARKAARKAAKAAKRAAREAAEEQIRQLKRAGKPVPDELAQIAAGHMRNDKENRAC